MSGGVRDAVGVEPDGSAPVGRRHAPVHRERRAARRGPDADGAQRRGGLGRRMPDRLEDRLDIGLDELAVPADPRTAELERDGHGMVVRRADGDALRRAGPPPARRSTAPAPPARRRGCRGRRPRSRRGRRPASLDHEDRRPQLEVVSLRDLVELVAPAAGRDPDRRRDVRPPDAGAHAGSPRRRAAARPGDELRREDDVGRAARRRAAGRGAARPPSGPSRRCRDGRRRPPAGRGR